VFQISPGMRSIADGRNPSLGTKPPMDRGTAADGGSFDALVGGTASGPPLDRPATQDDGVTWWQLTGGNVFAGGPPLDQPAGDEVTHTTIKPVVDAPPAVEAYADGATKA